MFTPITADPLIAMTNAFFGVDTCTDAALAEL